MKKIALITVTTLLIISAGCNGGGKSRELLTVDWKKDKVLRYQFMSDRDIYVDWNPSKETSIKDKRAAYTEFVEAVIAYKPIEINPYGSSIIEGKCESVHANRTKHEGRESDKRDAITSLEGKTFRFTIGPNGEITDYSDLDKIVKEAGKAAFRPRGNAGLIKEPDMIGDFIAIQWFLWDPVSSIDNPAKGVRIGQSWKGQISLPVPMILKAARDVTYTLSEIRQSNKGKLAVIKSNYSLAKTITHDWPFPYPDGVFQMSGPFGFFRNYKLLDLQGQGEEIFNIDAGRIEEYNQSYKLKLEAGIPIALGISPQIFIDQIMKMNRLEDGEPKQ